MSNDTHNPSTNFAGDSGPQSSANIAWGAGIIFFLLSPLTYVAAAAAYVSFAYGRISYKVILACVGLYTFILLVTGLLFSSATGYLTSFTHLKTIIDSGFATDTIAPSIFQMLLQQAPISILLGGVVGSIYCWINWIRRPSWKEFNFRLTPWQIWKKKKNIKDIKNDRNGPIDGRTLGINASGEKIVQTETESAAHTFVVGASGTGKTTTLLTGARDAIRRGEGFVFIDMKGSEDVPRIIAALCARYNRRFYHWTSQNPRMPYEGPAINGPAYYDAIGRGDATRRKDLLMAGREWSEDHYRLIVEDYLQRAMEIAIAVPPESNVDSLADILNVLDPDSLKKRSLNVVGDPYYDNIVAEINYMTDKKIDRDVIGAIEGMRRQIGILRDSIQGRWLRKDPDSDNDINLFDVAHNGDVVVFTLDSANYENNARNIGNLIIQDLKTVSSELRDNPARSPLNIIIDEFSAIGTDNIIGLIARSRDANMPVTLSTQSLGDLRAVDESFLDRIVGIVGAFIIHRSNSFKDAEIYAGLIGKEEKQFFNQGVEHKTSLFGGLGRGAGTGRGTIETKEDYIVSPDAIQKLGRGKLIYVSKTDTRLENVEVITESKNIAHAENDSKPIPSIVRENLENKTRPLLLPASVDLDKYRVDPTINGNKYQDSDFDSPEQKINHANPDRIREIFGRKNTDNISLEPIDNAPLAPAVSLAKDTETAIVSPVKKLPASVPARPQRSLGLPSLPELRPETLASIEALDIEAPEPKNVNAMPIRPRRGNIALPVISLTDSNNPETSTVEVVEDPNAWD